MFETKFFSIDKLRKTYAEYWRNVKKDREDDWRDLDEENNEFFDSRRIQLVSLAQRDPEYAYLKDRWEKYFYLQCLLHGAAKRIKSEEEKKQEQAKREDHAHQQSPSDSKIFEDRLQDFLINELRLLWGMFCFIDPKAINEESAAPFYLIGRFSAERLKPSFTFPLFVNARNIRSGTEFHRLPDEWLSFYVDFNAETRRGINFTDDFVKFFSDQVWRRNKKLEQKDNFFYASSGEIDHTILQWLFCSLGRGIQNKGHFAINIAGLFKSRDQMDKCLNFGHHDAVLKKITCQRGDDFFLGKTNSGEAFSGTIHDWLQRFGLLDESKSMLPTERLTAAIEFFYFHLKLWHDKRTGDKRIGFITEFYFSKGEEDNPDTFYRDLVRRDDPALKKLIRDFIDKCEASLPVSNKSYATIREETKDPKNFRGMLSEVVDSYLKVLEACASKSPGIAFADYSRFNVLSHFFQRNVLPFYNPLLKEETCRGFIIIPIFSNPHESEDHNPNESSKSIKNLGYFLGLIKDSDSKGKCYFNWRTHSDNTTESKTVNFFYEEYLFYLQNFVYNLGFNEVKQIYYKGIEEKHNNEIKRQAGRAAISQVMARNMSHNIGSHVLSRYKSNDDFVSDNLTNPKQYLAKSLNTNLILSVPTTKPRQKIEIAATQRAYFNEYLKDRMDFLADIATTDPTLESPLYLLKDVLAGFDKNRILLNRISGLEGQVEFDIKLQIRTESGATVDIQGEDNNNDPLLAFPNDILGCQAFYIILENIIRNVTKHTRGAGRQNGNEPFNFVINLLIEPYSENGAYYQVSIYDSFYKAATDIDTIVENRNKLIGLPVLNEKTNKLRDIGLGSVEMVVCGAYLRRIPLDLIEDDFYNITDLKYLEHDGRRIPNIIYAYSQLSSTNPGEAALGYKFYMRRPQKLLVFDDDNLLQLEDTAKAEHRAKGINVLSTGTFRKDYEYSHEFLIWLNNKESFAGFYDIHKTALPRRVLFGADFGEDGFSLNWSSEKLEETVWKVYLNKLLQEKSISSLSASYEGRPDVLYEHSTGGAGSHRKIVIDDHYGHWTDYQNRKDLYYEMSCSHHRLRKLSLNIPHQRMKYFEGVVTQIVIIDERIQANVVSRKYAETVPLNAYFENLGVFIPTKDQVDLNRPNFHEGQTESVQATLRNYLAPLMGTVDFCVLHLGILEKLFDKDQTMCAETIDEKIKWLVGEPNLDKVVITSGRGKPTNASSTFRYVPLAIIQHCVETLFDKYLLVRALHNSRRSR
jgi:hypothetical protein